MSAPSAPGFSSNAVMVLWYPMKSVAFLLLCRLVQVQCCCQRLVCWSCCGCPPALHTSVWFVQCGHNSGQIMMLVPTMLSPHYTPTEQTAAVICPKFLLCFVVPVCNHSHHSVQKCRHLISCYRMFMFQSIMHLWHLQYVEFNESKYMNFKICV